MLSTKNFFRNGILKSSQIVHDLFNVCQGMNTLNADWMKIIGDSTLLIVVIFVRKKSNRNNLKKEFCPLSDSLWSLKGSYQKVGGCSSNWKVFQHQLYTLEIAQLAYFLPMQKSKTCELFHRNEILKPPHAVSREQNCDNSYLLQL